MAVERPATGAKARGFGGGLDGGFLDGTFLIIGRAVSSSHHEHRKHLIEAVMEGRE